MKKINLESFEQFEMNDLNKVKGGLAEATSSASLEARKKDKSTELATVSGNCADISKDGVSSDVACV